MKLTFSLAAYGDLIQLHEFYLQPRRHPFFVDISGPPPAMLAEEFRSYCSQNDAQVLLCQSGNEILGCAHFRDKQTGLELANFDAFFLDYPKPGSKENSRFKRAFVAACKKQKLSRVQLLALSEETEKIACIEALGFKREGVLREHFYYAPKYHDLVMLGWTSPDREKRLLKLEESDGEKLEPVQHKSGASTFVPKDKTGMRWRRVDVRDAAILIQWYGHPEIQEVIEDEELSPEGLRAKAAKLATLDPFRDGECAYIFRIWRRARGTGAHFMWIDWVSRTAELDFFLAPDSRGALVALRVLEGIGRIAFETYQLHKVYGFSYGSNEIMTSRKRYFMTNEAILKDYLTRDGRCVDVYVQGHLAKEYFSVKSRKPAVR